MKTHCFRRAGRVPGFSKEKAVNIPHELPSPVSQENVTRLLESGAAIRKTWLQQPGKAWGAVVILGSNKTEHRYMAMLCGGDAFFGYTEAQAATCANNNSVNADVFRVGPCWEI
jgi:hypothetical protein